MGSGVVVFSQAVEFFDHFILLALRWCGYKIAKVGKLRRRKSTCLEKLGAATEIFLHHISVPFPTQYYSGRTVLAQVWATQQQTIIVAAGRRIRQPRHDEKALATGSFQTMSPCQNETLQELSNRFDHLFYFFQVPASFQQSLDIKIAIGSRTSP